MGTHWYKYVQRTKPMSTYGLFVNAPKPRYTLQHWPPCSQWKKFKCKKQKSIVRQRRRWRRRPMCMNSKRNYMQIEWVLSVELESVYSVHMCETYVFRVFHIFFFFFSKNDDDGGDGCDDDIRKRYVSYVFYIKNSKMLIWCCRCVIYLYNTQIIIIIIHL